MKLVKASMALEKAYDSYITEWEDSGEQIVPMAAIRNGMSYQESLDNWAYYQSDKAFEKGFVPATNYFLVDENGHIKGCLNFRHTLNDNLLIVGGHIGYGVCPSERGKGYAVMMLQLFLESIKDDPLNRVLITCDDGNIASYKTIIACGGELENIVNHKGKKVRRYWIQL